MRTNQRRIGLFLTGIAIIAVLRAPLIDADEHEEDQEPVQLTSLVSGPGDVMRLYRILTHNASMAETFSNGKAVVLVKVGSKEEQSQNDLHRFSFNYDGRPARQFARVSDGATRELLDAMKEPRNYELEENHAHCVHDEEERRLAGEEYDKVWSQDVALEIAADPGFLRIYFDKDFTQCYFLSDSREGGRSKDWRMNAQITNILRKIVKEADGKWQELHLKRNPANAGK